jgi:hypothetical protein
LLTTHPRHSHVNRLPHYHRKWINEWGQAIERGDYMAVDAQGGGDVGLTEDFLHHPGWRSIDAIIKKQNLVDIVLWTAWRLQGLVSSSPSTT